MWRRPAERRPRNRMDEREGSCGQGPELRGEWLREEEPVGREPARNRLLGSTRVEASLIEAVRCAGNPGERFCVQESLSRSPRQGYARQVGVGRGPQDARRLQSLSLRKERYGCLRSNCGQYGWVR